MTKAGVVSVQVCSTLSAVAPNARVDVVTTRADAPLRRVDGPMPDLALLNRHLPHVDGLHPVLALLAEPRRCSVPRPRRA